jgi:hypothetical protein
LVGGKCFLLVLADVAETVAELVPVVISAATVDLVNDTATLEHFGIVASATADLVPIVVAAAAGLLLPS